jgi:hypothetical protein
MSDLYFPWLEALVSRQGNHVPSSSLELEILGDGKGGSSSVVIDLDRVH